MLGEVIAQRIDELADYLAGDDQPGEGYFAKVARLTAAREHAQERVLGDLLLPPVGGGGLLPWQIVMIAGWGLTEQGRKVSKRDIAKSTAADGYSRYVPDAVMGKYGAAGAGLTCATTKRT